MPEGLQPVGFGIKPTTTRVGLARLIFQTGHGAPTAARPVVYRFPDASPVRPSIANGVMTLVVKVAFDGSGASRSSSSARAAEKTATKAIPAASAAAVPVFMGVAPLVRSLHRPSG